MDEADARAEAFFEVGEAILGRREIADFGFLDQRTDPVDALAFVDRASDGLDHLLKPRQRNRAGVDRLASGRFLAQFGDVHVAEIGEHQRARDRRRGHDQDVDRFALACERKALMHAEAMLLVDDREREVLERHVVLEQRMGADQEIDIAVFEPRQDVGALLAALAAGEDGDVQAGGFGERRDGLQMLAGEDFGRRHQRGLPSAFDHGGGGEQRDHGLSRSDIALQHAQHAFRLAEIGDDGLDRLVLRQRQRIGQGGDDLSCAYGRRRRCRVRIACVNARAPARARSGLPAIRHRRAASRPALAARCRSAPAADAASSMRIAE